MMASFGSFTMSLCGFFGETLINENNEKIDTDGFFPFEVAENILLYCNFILYVFPSCAIIALLLMFQFKKQLKIKPETQEPEGLSTPNTEVSDKPLITNEAKSIYNINNTNTTIQEGESLIAKENTIVDNQIIASNTNEESPFPQRNPNLPFDQKPKPKKSNLSKVISNRRVWILALLNYLSLFSVICVSSTYRVIATIKKYDIQIPKYTNLISGVIVIVIGPMWGFLSDKYSYKSLFVTINVFVVIVCCSLYFTFELPLVYSSLFICNKILMMGYIMIKTPYIMKIFSMKYFMEVNAMIAVVSGFNQIISSVFNYYISNWATDIDSNLPYLFGFCGAALLNVIGIVVGCIYLSDEPFNYKEEIVFQVENKDLISNKSTV